MSKIRRKAISDAIYALAGLAIIYVSYRFIVAELNAASLQIFGVSWDASELWYYIIGGIGMSWGAVALSVFAMSFWKESKRCLAMFYWIFMAVLEMIVIVAPFFAFKEGLDNMATFARYGLGPWLGINECLIALSVPCSAIVGHVQALLIVRLSRD